MNNIMGVLGVLALVLGLSACAGLPVVTEPESAAEMDHGRMGHMEPLQADGAMEAPDEAQGAQPLSYTLSGGVKVFTITAKPVRWSIAPGVMMSAYTYNETVPGPLIRVSQGDRVRILLRNQLSEPTTIHLHGISLDNAMDGVPGMTQDPVYPGESFSYEFTAVDAGTFMYHSHYRADAQVGAGLYAPLIVDAAAKTDSAPLPDVEAIFMLSEILIRDGKTYPAMPMAGMEPNYFLINGKSFPSVPELSVKKGQRVRLRFLGIGQFIHPMHLHGFPFRIVATDGHDVPSGAQWTKDTVSVAPGERYDVEFVADRPGDWMLHCHILHHTTSDGEEPGGLMMVVKVIE